MTSTMENRLKLSIQEMLSVEIALGKKKKSVLCNH